MGCFIKQACGFTQPVNIGKEFSSIPDHIIGVHHKVQEKKKLTMVLHSQATEGRLIISLDLVEFFSKKNREKQGSCVQPKPI